MKLYIYFTRMLVLVLLVSFFSCSEDAFDISDQQLESEDLELDAVQKKLKADLIIFPSGDLSGTTDAGTILDALNALPPGGLLLLESGTFYVNKPIIVSGFNGTMTGMGPKKTQIVGVGDNSVPFKNDLISNPNSPILIQGGAFFFFTSPSGDVTVSDMAMSLPDDFATELNFSGGKDLISFIIVNLGNDAADTHFDKLKLSGTDSNASGFFISQPTYPIVVSGNRTNFPTLTSGGIHEVTKSEIIKAGIGAISFQGFKDASIIIEKNTISEVKNMQIRYITGCDVTIEKNMFQSIELGGILVSQEGFLIPGVSNTVSISKNEVYTAGFTNVEIGFIQPGGAGFDLVIDKNELTNLGPGPLGIIPNLYGLFIGSGNDNAVVEKNKIKGQARYGIYQDADHGLFDDNDLKKINTSIADYGLIGDYNTVIDKDKGTTIDDQGTGNIVSKK